MQQEFKLGQLEALLFAAGEPLGVPQLAELLGMSKPQTWELLGLLQEEYKTEKHGLELREVAEGWQLCTKACHHEAILQLANTQELKLTNASMETLAIIAYRQPVTRAEMEAIRGEIKEWLRQTVGRNFCDATEYHHIHDSSHQIGRAHV